MKKLLITLGLGYFLGVRRTNARNRNTYTGGGGYYTNYAQPRRRRR